MNLMMWVFVGIGVMALGMVGFAVVSPANGDPTNVGSSSSSKKRKKSGVTQAASDRGERQARVAPLRGDYARAYEGGPSFTDLLPWLEYVGEDEQLLLIDAVTRVAMYEIEPIPTEGRTEEYLMESVQMLSQMISDTFPEHGRNPWVLQFYVSGEGDLSGFIDHMKSYINPEILKTKHTQAFLKMYEEHYRDVTNDAGYFEDDMITKSRWRGRRNRIRVVLYRKYNDAPRGVEPRKELEEVCERFVSNLDGGEFKYRRMNGEDFYYWMLFWFNPRPEVAGGHLSGLKDVAPYPGDEDLPIGADLSEMLCLNPPRSDVSKGFMYFDGLAHATLQVTSIRSAPRPGHTTGEDKKGTCILDKLPEGSTISYTLTVSAQDEILNRITVVKERAVGDTAESRHKREDADLILDKQNTGDKIYPVEMCVYIRGDDEEDLKRKINMTRALLGKNGMNTVEVSREAAPIDNYIKNLPAVYNAELDMKARKKSTPYFVSHASALAPVFGRSRGTGNPGLIFFNRSGEPCCADPLNYGDRTKSAHTLIFGPTGAGKSATTLSIIDSLLAIHRPRVFIVEMGNSFGIFGDYLESNGLSVHKTRLSMNSDVSIPPFYDALKLLDDVDDDDLRRLEDHNRSDDEEEDDTRDLIGELELTAQIMVTGGEEGERLSRGQRLALRVGLINAAKRVRAEFGPEGIVIPSDLAEEVLKLANTDEFKHQAKEVADMSQAIQLFCTGLNGHLFNRRHGQLWPEVDVNIIDLGQAAGEGKGDTLDVAYVSLMLNVNTIGERDQYSDRQTIVVTDEGHLVFTRYQLPIIVTKIVKLWRKIGIVKMVATQNVTDLSDSASKLINLMEWWICLAMPKEEVEQLARFKDLTEEEKHMLQNAVKNPGKYVEGVLMNARIRTLFRNVPPSLPLALAMTEQSEKNERANVIKELGLEGDYAEMEAAKVVAERIREKRIGSAV